MGNPDMSCELCRDYRASLWEIQPEAYTPELEDDWEAYRAVEARYEEHLARDH